MTKNTEVALRAATLFSREFSIGPIKAREMVRRADVPMYLYVLARQLIAAQKISA